jgi:hypothetical protein
MKPEERGSYFGAHDLPDMIRQHQRDARVDEVDDQGRTPLFYAQTVLEARFLVLVGADPEHRDRTGAPAQYHAGPEVGHYLVHGPKASYFGAHHKMLWSLNQLAGANPNERDEQGRTPIFYAQAPEEVAFLIDAGADPSVLDPTGASPLFTVPGGTGVVEFLVAHHDLDPNKKDYAGNSILHLTQDVELLKDALAVGTTPMLVNKAGRNAIEYRETHSSGAQSSSNRTNQGGNNPPQGGSAPSAPGEEGLIMGILRGIFGAFTEVLGARSHRR